ncbi:MAG TPA: aminoglycoside phosphotransferase, partial [Planctomycetaceae bacterium]|nr:aminoglycoside phosphotransferase [Planctomycetaceae bacterium]
CSTPASTNRVWLHGDLHPRNVIIRDGTLVGVIDWGDLNGGDAATDLACAWLLLDTAVKRQEFF